MTQIRLRRITDLTVGNPTDNAQFVYREAGSDRRVSLQSLRTILVGDEQQVLVTQEFVTFEAIGALRLVATNNNNQWVLASNTNSNHMGRVAGISVNSYSAGVPARMVQSGTIFDSSWTWVPKGQIYVGTNGLLTQTPPNLTTAKFYQIVGTALTAQRILFRLETPLQID